MSIYNSTLYGVAVYGTDVYDAPESGFIASSSSSINIDSTVVKNSSISLSSISYFFLSSGLIYSNSLNCTASTFCEINTLLTVNKIISSVNMFVQSFFEKTLGNIKGNFEVFKTGEVLIDGCTSDFYIDPTVIYLKYLDLDFDSVIQEEIYVDFYIAQAVILVETENDVFVDSLIYEYSTVSSDAIIQDEVFVELFSDSSILENLNNFVFADSVMQEEIFYETNSDTIIQVESFTEIDSEAFLVTDIFIVNIETELTGYIIQNTELLMYAYAEIFNEMINYDIEKYSIVISDAFMDISFYNMHADAYIYETFFIASGTDKSLLLTNITGVVLIYGTDVINIYGVNAVSVDYTVITSSEKEKTIKADCYDLFNQINPINLTNISANISYYPLVPYYNAKFYTEALDTKSENLTIGYSVIVIPEINNDIFCDGFIFDIGLSISSDANIYAEDIIEMIASYIVIDQLRFIIPVQVNINQYIGSPKEVRCDGYIFSNVVFPVISYRRTS